MVVRELLTRLGFQIDGRNINIYNTTINNITNNAERAATAVSGLFGALLGFGTIKAIAHTADDMQALEARVGELPQTITSAADAFDVVTSRASAARQSIDAYTNFYIKLQHAGKDFIKTQEEGLKVTDTISKALILGGATAQEQASTLLQFGQAIGSNVLQGDEFRALAESAPQLVDAIGKQLGIARSDLKKYASEGKLTAQAVIGAVSAISTEFDDRFKRMPLSIATATTIIGNRWATFINRLNRESSAVTKTANFFLKAFDSIEKGLANMVDFFGGATNTLKFFGIALAAALAPLIFRTAAGAIAFLLSPMGLLLSALILVGLAIEDFYQWMTGGTSVFQQWFGNFDDAMAKLKEFSGWITAIKIAVASAVGVMVLNWIWAAGVAVASAAATSAAWIASLARFAAAMVVNAIAVGGWVASLLAGVASLAAGWIASFASMAVAAAPIILPILGIAAGIGLVIAALLVFADNWKLVFQTIKDIATGNWSAVADDFGKMVDRMKGYWNSFKTFFGFGVNANVGPGSVTPATAAGAAASANGVPSPQAGGSVVIQIDQTLPPGTSAETAMAARDAVNQAFNALPMDRLARQMGQVGG